MVKKILIFILIYASSVFSQVQWDKNGIKGASAVSSQLNLSSVSTDAGGVFFAYENNPQGDADIYVQYVDGAGNTKWGTSGVVVATAAGNQKRPSVALDGSGGVYVAWEDEVSEDIYIQHLDSQGNELWTKGGIRACSASGLQSRVKAVSDENGGVILVWVDERSGSGTDIYAQRINSSGNVLWHTDGVAVCTESGNQSSQVIKPDGAGGVYVAWQDYRNGYTNIDIYVQHINSSGLSLFGTQGLAVVTSSNNQQKPDIDVFNGYLFISWQDYRSGTNNDIYAQKIDNSGNVLWGTNGYPVCTSGGHQTNSRIVSDGLGGAIIVWDDNRTGYDIYGQRISSEGLPVWEPNGMAVNSSEGYQYTTKLVSDGANGAFVVWNDDRSSPSDPNLMAQHIKSDGTLLFDVQGLSVADTTGYQDGHEIVSDGSGGFFAVWRDARDGNSDVYIQHISDAIVITSPVSDELWAGDVEHTINWDIKPESVIFDHYVIKASVSPGDGYPVTVVDNVSKEQTSVNWTPLTVSSSTVRLRIDCVLQDGTTTASFYSALFRIDSAPPAVFHLLEPADNTSTTLNVTFKWESTTDALSGLDHYELWLNNSVYTDTLHSTSVNLDLSEGDYVWSIKAVDKAGVVRESSESWNLSTSRDTDPPTVFHLQSPANNSWTKEEYPVFEWSGSTDAGSGLKKYMFYFDGQLMRDNIVPTQHTVTDVLVTPGSHSWYVVAVDSVGNSMESEEINTFFMDNVQPKVFSIIGPADGTWSSTATPEFSWQAVSDTGVGLARVQLWVDDQLLIDNINPSGTSLVPGSTYALSEGSHQWYMTAVDSLGNTRKSTETFTVNIDISRPNLFNLVTPEDSSYVLNTKPSFEWEPAHDDISSISYYKFYIDETLIADNLTGLTFIPDNDLTEGVHQWKVKAFDLAGNSKISTRFCFTLDVTPPEEFSLISPAQSGVLHVQKPEFKWNSTNDLVSGFRSYTFVVNGVTTVENIARLDTSIILEHIFENGSYTWHVTAYDSAGNSFNTPEQSFTIDCNPPDLASSANVEAVEDQAFSYTLQTHDPDGDNVEVTFTAVPSWLSRNNFTFSGTPGEFTQDTVITFTLFDGIYTVPKSVTINVVHVNDPPVLTSADHADAVEDQPFSYTATATDAENDDLVFTYPVLPKWLSAAGTKVSGTPREGDTDTCFVVIVSDGTDTDTLKVSVTVTPVNDPPEIVSADTVTATEGSVFRYKAQVEDPDSKNVIVKYLNLPKWLKLSGPELRGIPGNADSDTCFSVVAFDGELSDTLCVFVSVVHVNSPPEFTTELGSWQFFDVDTLEWTVNLNEYVSDPDDPDTLLTWTYELPDTNNVSVSINAKTHIATIKAFNTQGTFRVIFTATDPHGLSCSSTLTLQIIMTYVDQTQTVVPRNFKLYQNYPNPFNNTTIIKYDVPKTSRVIISVYNTIGQKIDEPVNSLLQPGSYKVEIDGTSLSTGVYFVLMQSSEYRRVLRMVFLR